MRHLSSESKVATLGHSARNSRQGDCALRPSKSIKMRVSSAVILVIVFVEVEVMPQDRRAVILQSVNTLGINGNFAYGFQSSNGIRFQARGSPARPSGQAIAGRFSWTAPDSQSFAVQFTADENGYQPLGVHLPTPPPIPLAILRAIDYNDRHPEEDESQN